MRQCYECLLRLSISEWLVANKRNQIMKAFFESIGALVGLITNSGSPKLKIPNEQQEIIEGLGFGESLLI